MGKRLLHLTRHHARPFRLLHLLGRGGVGPGGLYADRPVPGAAPERAGLAGRGGALRGGGRSSLYQLRGGRAAPTGAGHERQHQGVGPSAGAYPRQLHNRGWGTARKSPARLGLVGAGAAFPLCARDHAGAGVEPAGRIQSPRALFLRGLPDDPAV